MDNYVGSFFKCTTQIRVTHTRVTFQSDNHKVVKQKRNTCSSLFHIGDTQGVSPFLVIPGHP